MMNSFDLGRELTAVTMGIDAFERKNTEGRGEGLVPIYMGSDLVEPRGYEDWDEIRCDLVTLATNAELLAPGPRQVFLRDMVKSLHVAVRLFSGGSPTFEEKVADLVGAPKGRERPEIIENARDNLDALLSKAGFARGTLQERVHEWEHERSVPQDKIETVFHELMVRAKARTAEKIFDTGDYDMVLNPVRDMHYTARCSFNEGKMDLNFDIRFTRAALKHLVCHEVFPGHSTQLIYTRAEVDAGKAPADALLVTANAVTGCIQEGIGDQGIHLIDFVEDYDDEIHSELRRLRSAAQTSAAWMLMVEGAAAEDVANYLRETAIGQEAWVTGRLRMAAHPFHGPFIASYWAGNESVRRVRERVSKEQWPDFLVELFGRANSPASLEMFPKASVQGSVQ